MRLDLRLIYQSKVTERLTEFGHRQPGEACELPSTKAAIQAIHSLNPLPALSFSAYISLLITISVSVSLRSCSLTHAPSDRRHEFIPGPWGPKEAYTSQRPMSKMFKTRYVCLDCPFLLPIFTRLTVSARHYSYECKVQLQERPYNPRPSRTQQLLNPKLVPKLTNDTPDDSTRKYASRPPFTLFPLPSHHGLC